MSTKTTIIVEEEDEFEDWQYEQSGNKALEFIESKILPILESFDFESEDKDYVKGTAHFVLFVELLPKLGQLGYDADDLLDMIQELVDSEANITIH